MIEHDQYIYKKKNRSQLIRSDIQAESLKKI